MTTVTAEPEVQFCTLAVTVIDSLPSSRLLLGAFRAKLAAFVPGGMVTEDGTCSLAGLLDVKSTRTLASGTALTVARRQNASALGGIAAQFRRRKVRRDRDHHDEIETGVPEGKRCLVAGDGPCRVVDIVANVEVLEAEIRVARGDRPAAAGLAAPKPVRPYARDPR